MAVQICTDPHGHRDVWVAQAKERIKTGGKFDSLGKRTFVRDPDEGIYERCELCRNKLPAGGPFHYTTSIQFLLES